MVEVKHIVTLKEDEISSEIVIKNSKGSSLCFMGSVLSHLVASTPDATYAVGLQSSNFFDRPPLLSNCTITVPNSSQRDDMDSKNFWGPLAFKDFFAGWGAKTQNNKDGVEGKESEEFEGGEEEDDYKHLTEKMSRIYTSAPRSFTVIDRVINTFLFICSSLNIHTYVYSQDKVRPSPYTNRLLAMKLSLKTSPNVLEMKFHC